MKADGWHPVGSSMDRFGVDEAQEKEWESVSTDVWAYVMFHVRDLVWSRVRDHVRVLVRDRVREEQRGLV